MRWGRRTVVALVALAAAASVLTGCSSSAPAPTGSATASASPARPTPTSSPTPTPVDPLLGMSLDQRVGQLFMVGTSVGGVNATTLDAVADGQVGGIFLHGRSSAGVESIAQLVAQFTSAAPAGSPRLWVATDQEGGDVQTLTGPGFDDMPSALVQGRSAPDALQDSATTWGDQLAKAGVDMNLAPVADIVTNPQTAKSNREYGYDESTVVAGAGAFAQGMRDADVMPTLKHFPGLGHVGSNTDTASGVTDDFVTSDGADVDVYRKLLAEGPAVVMLSTAIYANIDPSAPAAFSSIVATSLLRDTLGFEGVITTDDLSSAVQVQSWSPADRATLAISAGVDLVLVASDPSVYPEMYAAVLAKAKADPSFASRVDDAARTVVVAKKAAL